MFFFQSSFKIDNKSFVIYPSASSFWLQNKTKNLPSKGLSYEMDLAFDEIYGRLGRGRILNL
jgi:hypothetical protein